MTDEIHPAKIPDTPPINKINGRPSKSSLQRAQLDLHDNQLRYAVWMSIPSDYRIPGTRREFAKSIGVTEATLWRWSKDPNVVMASRWLAIQNVGDVGRISNIIEFLYETSMDKDLGTRVRLDAARDFMNAIGVRDVHKFDNKLFHLQDVTELDLDTMTDEELWEIYNQRALQAGLDTEFPHDDDNEVVDAEVVNE